MSYLARLKDRLSQVGGDAAQPFDGFGGDRG